MSEIEVWPGRPFPLGPTWNGRGTNFSLFSENAERVELCLFDEDDNEARIEVVDGANALHPLADVLRAARGLRHFLEQALREEMAEGVDVAHQCGPFKQAGRHSAAPAQASLRSLRKLGCVRRARNP